MKAKILNLKPTQCAVGMDEVEFRVKEMSKMKPKQLHEYLRSHKIPVIRGPEGLYLIDKHHLVRACWEMGLTHVPVVIKADLRNKKFARFWHEMHKNGWAYFKDQFGKPIWNVEDLPRSVRSLADNPWRSLAWRVRIKGGFDKSPEPFAEFQWAEFFRKMFRYIKKDDIKHALLLCQTDMAKRLPGYKGPFK